MEHAVGNLGEPPDSLAEGTNTSTSMGRREAARAPANGRLASATTIRPLSIAGG